MSTQNVSVSVNIEGKNLVIAYVLWWFLGALGVHRFYLGRTGSGFAQLFLSLIGWLTLYLGIGIFLLVAWVIWWSVDAYFVYKIVEEVNSKLGINTSSFSLSKTGDLKDGLEQLEKLHSLYEKGVLSKSEYEQKRALLV